MNITWNKNTRSCFDNFQLQYYSDELKEKFSMPQSLQKVFEQKSSNRRGLGGQDGFASKATCTGLLAASLLFNRGITFDRGTPENLNPDNEYVDSQNETIPGGISDTLNDNIQAIIPNDNGQIRLPQNTSFERLERNNVLTLNQGLGLARNAIISGSQQDILNNIIGYAGGAIFGFQMTNDISINSSTNFISSLRNLIPRVRELLREIDRDVLDFNTLYNVFLTNGNPTIHKLAREILENLLKIEIAISESSTNSSDMSYLLDNSESFKNFFKGIVNTPRLAGIRNFFNNILRPINPINNWETTVNTIIPRILLSIYSGFIINFTDGYPRHFVWTIEENEGSYVIQRLSEERFNYILSEGLVWDNNASKLSTLKNKLLNKKKWVCLLKNDKILTTNTTNWPFKETQEDLKGKLKNFASTCVQLNPTASIAKYNQIYDNINECIPTCKNLIVENTINSTVVNVSINSILNELAPGQSGSNIVNNLIRNLNLLRVNGLFNDFNLITEIQNSIPGITRDNTIRLANLFKQVKNEIDIGSVTSVLIAWSQNDYNIAKRGEREGNWILNPSISTPQGPATKSSCKAYTIEEIKKLTIKDRQRMAVRKASINIVKKIVPGQKWPDGCIIVRQLIKKLQELQINARKAAVKGAENEEDQNIIFNNFFNNRLRKLIQTYFVRITEGNLAILIDLFKKLGQGKINEDSFLVALENWRAIWLKQLKEAGYTVDQLILTGYTVDQLIEAGFTLVQLIEAAKQMKEARYTAKQLKNVGFTIVHLIPTGFTVDQLKAVGFTVDEYQLIEAAKQLIPAGYTVDQLKKAGFTLVQLIEAAKQLKKAGFTVDQLKKAGFTVDQLKSVGIVHDELRT